jgi:hypothetical protein
LLNGAGEGRVNLVIHGRGKSEWFHAEMACGVLHFIRLRLRPRVVGVDQPGDNGCTRHQFMQQTQLILVKS